MSKKNKRTNRSFYHVILGIVGLIVGVSVVVGLKGNLTVTVLGISMVSVSAFSIYGGLFLWD